MTDTPSTDREESLPPFAEQVSAQLGGWRGIIESSLPVIVFVIANAVSELRPAIIIAVASALGIAGLRLAQRRPIRHAINGLVGVAIGAALAWNTGEERDFYAPGIIWTLGYAVALLGSVFVRQPLVGWIWSVVAAGGKSEWRESPRLLKAFGWLTIAWAVVYFVKVGVQTTLYLEEMTTALAVSRIALGFPPYALLLAGTIWAVRRIQRNQAAELA